MTGNDGYLLGRAAGAGSAMTVAGLAAGEPFLKPAEAAAILRVSRSALNSWRFHGKGPHYYRVGRQIRYRRSDLEAWCRNQNAGVELKLEPLRAAKPNIRAVPLFEDFSTSFLAWSESNHRPATTRLHRFNLNVLCKHFGGRRLDDITTWMVESFKADRLQEYRRGHRWTSQESLEKKVSPVAANRALTTLKLLFRLARQCGE
jgi:hypothetical protein